MIGLWFSVVALCGFTALLLCVAGLVALIVRGYVLLPIVLLGALAATVVAVLSVMP